ncbi:2-succinyl-5-enolpyruvyl-6-hydroxy-3-cyclohexene-1-carboxylic-acid synthase [Lawsonella clevelandensis]|uniref:2-succinyl-5-enolpyruvyl-6-hydroxy-3- cyclohexene-1-carboxylic-acid synthase n=1 Tax=Lawsonella clevelandensis TaxID=1528099 RepID=UPI0023F582DC|nr:2-succinyl-5-enolpyruvyl-6-hydroxy-3-cyclohexene-1-carboxylic-acid synthase [Lawsonella clevelandensis]
MGERTVTLDLSPATLHARVVVDELIRNGMQEAVLCPGSRSTPLAFALAAAEAAGRLTLHVRVDERSAGFLALGLTAASGTPVAVVCTSGSAVANLHPAAVEARFNHRQVVFLTANRPPEMEGVGAQQTIVQRGIFAHDIVDELVLPAAGSDVVAEADAHGWNAHWRAALCRTMARAAASAGPVHIDVPFREPLVSPIDSAVPPVNTALPPVDETPLPPCWQGRSAQRPWTEVCDTATVDLSLRTLVIAGQGSWELPALTGVPTLCEPGGRASGVLLNPLCVSALLADPAHAPQQLVVVGKPTLHRSVTRLLADPALPQIVVTAPTAPTEWADVAGQAQTACTHLTTVGESPQHWLATCAEADGAAHAHVLDVVARLRAGQREDNPGRLPSGLEVAYAVGEAVAADPALLLFVGSSNPVRDLAVTHPDLGPRCWVNRGASGIDGNISTAMGLAFHHPGPIVAFLGDLAALHDSGGLLVPTLENAPKNLTILVANDTGGGIFATLEQGAPAYEAQFERLFGVPHTADFAALAAGWGVAYQQCTLAELPGVLTGYAEPAGVRLVEVRTQRRHRYALAATLEGR